MRIETERKFNSLKENLRGRGSVLIAFSGGVDSTFLLKTASIIPNLNLLGVTALSSTYPKSEQDEAVQLAKEMGVKHTLIDSEELDIPQFADNNPDRCYHCKKELFSKLKEIAKENGLKYVLDGSNADDSSDYRPGSKAVAELGIKSPLQEAGLTKEEIRELSKEMGLPTWDKPAMACLSSRFPYGEKITKDKLAAIEEGERFLRGLGFRQLRLRHHGNIARIELSKDDIKRVIEQNMSQQIIEKIKSLGFAYVTIDLEGYRTGSLNEVLPK
ncbi:MAG: ATP-dependent sacrificial sulfur transferase LarE [Nitrospinota bacterium]